jgi:dethiobiotin synthetase
LERLMSRATGLFVAGTDTDVGKTAVAVAIVQQLVAAGHRVGVFKPAASGVVGAGSDARLLWEAAGRPLSVADVCPQAFAAAIAPSDAARLEGRTVDERLLRDGVEPWRRASDVVVVEGAGGLFSPLGAASLNADVARDLGWPVVIVDAVRLGLIGRTLMAVRAARAAGLEVAAVVLSHARPPAGDPADPTGDLRLVEDGAAALGSFEPGLPIGILGHGVDRITPDLAWEALAGG